MKQKRKELQHYVKKKKLHCALFFNLSMNIDPNFFYLTHYDGYGCLILLKDREILLVPEMELQRARRTVKGVQVKVYRKNFWEVLRKYIKGKYIGLDFNAITLSMIKSLRKEIKGKRFVDVSALVRNIRSVKTKKEIGILRKACSKCFRNFRNFDTEKDVSGFLYIETIRDGCELSFPPIVASGSGSAEPHHTPKDYKLKKGFCIIDFGVKYQGYCSDTTRTVYIGKPSEKDKEIYQFMLTAQDNMIRSIKPGQRCTRAYDHSLKELGQYAKNFTHGLGHGVGVEIHELPDLRMKSKSRIEEGAVFTVEPGIYFYNRFGIRIEDTVLMEKRPVLLTRISKKLRIF
ncbi:MAG: Xaa-Pro peptidase family protein [Candidatus Woesearchaeota archaeon]|nr:Xaa-Pro peptidase family protein [Candidatus Woesearchaeota archaeon]